MKLVTVITVCYNARFLVERTISSVLEQACDSVEFIVIDGKSTDGSQEVICRYADKIDFYLSESDKGIYDAMNKGIQHATGKYVFFLNVNDVFYEPNTVLKICKLMENDDYQHDIYYGNVAISNEYGLYIMKPRSLELLKWKMILSHQAVFVRTSLLKNNLFDLKYRYSADYNQLSTLYLSGHSFGYLDLTIALTPTDSGATYDNYISSTKEHFLILRERGENVFWAEKKTIFLRWLIRRIKSTIPKHLLHPILRRIARYKII